MAVFQVGKSSLDLQILGAGVRDGVLPPFGPAVAWDLNEREMAALQAFEEAGWRFRPGSDLNWNAAKDLNGEDLEAGLLARHPRGGLVILTNHLIARLPSPDVTSPDVLHVRKLPLGTNVFDVKLRVPSEGLLARINGVLQQFNQMFALDGGGPIAEPHLLYHVVHPGSVQSDPGLDSQSQNHWDAIELEAAWEKCGKSGAGIRVAVIDTGFHIDESELHVDFRKTAFVNDAARIGVPRKAADGRISYHDAGGLVAASMPAVTHGSMCAGLVGAASGGTKVNGVVPNCDLMLVALQSVTSAVALAAAINLCVGGIDGEAGADVISGSLGPDVAWDYPTDLETSVQNAKNGRGKLGTLIAWASFNVDKEIPSKSFEANVVCVSQSKPNAYTRATSGYGPALDLLAPGINVMAFDPEVTDKWGYFSGSSCAAPMVAGTAALMLSVNPKLTAAQVESILKQSCDPQKTVMAHENAVGFGRLNALRAIERTPAP